MNGQMYQICCIVAAAKKALIEKGSISYIPMRYENRIEFCFLPQKQLFRQKNYTAENVLLWFEHCKRKKLQDVKFICPIAVKDPRLLGFSNTTESSICCFYENGGVTYFTPNWEFDSTKKEWNILYTEHEWPNPPSEKPRFKNNTDSFKKVLEEIGTLAVKIECDNFAKIFEDSIRLLEGSEDYPDTKYGLELPSLPVEHIHVFEAASNADVFGAMGSWNDSPAYMAYEKGLDTEYKMLSDELLKNIRMAILYAVNEW